MVKRHKLQDSGTIEFRVPLSSFENHLDQEEGGIKPTELNYCTDVPRQIDFCTRVLLASAWKISNVCQPSSILNLIIEAQVSYRKEKLWITICLRTHRQGSTFQGKLLVANALEMAREDACATASRNWETNQSCRTGLLFQQIGGSGLHMFYLHCPNREILGVNDFVFNYMESVFGLQP